MASTTFVDGETLIEATWLNDVNAAVYTPGTQTAADIANVPAGSITATDVQAALNELDTEKVAVASIGTTVQAWDAQLDALALLSTGTASGNIPLVGTESATTTVPGLVRKSTPAENAAGTGTGVVAAADLPAAVATLGATYRTANTGMPPAGSANSAAHPLARIPDHARIELLCVISEHGFGVGTVVEETGEWSGVGSASPIVVWKTSTAVGFNFSSGETFFLRDVSTGAAFIPTGANWVYRFVLD